VKYACIEHRISHYPIRMMCRLLSVSASGYYAWRTRPESPRAKTDRELLPEIKRIHAQSKGVYGSPKIKAELASEGCHVGRNKIARLMRLERLRGCPKRRFRVTTQSDPSHAVAKNLLQQDFSATAANQRWVADITYSAPSLRKLLWKMLSGLEHVWNASRTTLEETNWMPALCYGRA
jgi:hypothetical protein